MKLLPVLALVLALAGCGSETGEPSEPMQPGQLEHVLEQAEDGNFTLYVSNQSFERQKVHIKVWIDAFVAVDDDFEVGNQHNWIDFTFDLDDGKHTLRAESVAGEAVLEETFQVEGKRWAVVDYWCCDSGQAEPKFTFMVSEEPIAFA
jgi:hypothetical protein